MWVVGPLFIQKKQSLLSKVVKRVRRIRKFLFYLYYRTKRRIRAYRIAFFQDFWLNKLTVPLALILVCTSLLIFEALTAEPFPYDLRFFQKQSDITVPGSLAPDPKSFIEMGSGMLAFNRYEDIEYLVNEGDSLPEIAYLYNIEVLELMLYNNLESLEDLWPGRRLLIPSSANLVDFMQNVDRKRLNALLATSSQNKFTNNPTVLPRKVRITCDKRSDGQSVTAFFSVVDDIKEKGVYFEWNLGDGKKSFRKTFNYTYNAPGTYQVYLTVKDLFGNEIRSNIIYLDIPHATKIKNSNQLFLTVNNIGDVFSIDGEVISVYDALGRVSEPIIFVNKSEGKYYYQAHASGFFSLLALSPTGEKHIYLFVSPFESVNNDRMDVDWYRTQFATGYSNCGPAVASMAIGWATGEYVAVTSIRDLIGWQGNGSTSFFDLKNVLDRYRVPCRLTSINNKEDLFAMLDRGSIIGIVYQCGLISRVADNPQTNLIGRYYHDSTGHYSIIKGYTKDKRYFIVYDPIPSDWINNGLRYGDGISMIGRNRLYLADELYAAMSSGMVMEVSRPTVE